MSEEYLSEKLRTVPKGEPQCIWMRAGVVNYKLCPHNYGCYHCLFDKAIREKGVARAGSRYRKGWEDMLRRLPGTERWCRHMIQGLVTYKVCPNNYNCGTCEYDQMVQDRLGYEGVDESKLHRVAGFEVADGFHYHPAHLWARVEYGGMIRVGFDDFGTQMLGRKREVNLPRMGQKMEMNKEAFAVRAGGRQFNVRTPLDGTVIAVNPLYRNTDAISDLHPYEEGWVYMLEPSKRLQVGLKKLLWGETALEWMQEESDHLFQELKTGTTAASGGSFDRGFLDDLPAGERAGLIDTFLMK